MTRPWLEIWKECCFALNWFGPSKQTEINVMFVQRTQEYGNWFMNHAVMRHGVFIDKCVALPVSPVNGLVFHSAYVGGMNARHFNDFLVQTRQNLDPDEEVTVSSFTKVRQHIEISPSLRPILSWRCPRPTAHSSTQWSTEGSDERRRIEARNTGSNGIPLGGMRTRLLLKALQRCIGVITAAKAYQWFRFM